VPTQIIELDDLVPDAIEFRYKGKSYILPGDITVETTFRLNKLLIALTEAEADPKKMAQQEKLTLEVEEVLLELFRQTDHELKSLPLGVVGFQHVLSFLLAKLGFGQQDVEDDADPPPNRAARRKSARSNTSRSSSKNSTSRPTTTRR
jgi:hypothetical protein